MMQLFSNEATAHKIITALTLVALVLIVLIWFKRLQTVTPTAPVQSEGYSLFTEIPAVCGKQALKACEQLKVDAINAPPSQYERAFAAYEACVHSEAKKCSCQPDNKAKIMEACYNDLRNSTMFQDRVFGCYQAGTKEEVQKCFKDPYKYLCVDSKHPQQEQCEDIEAMCQVQC